MDEYATDVTIFDLDLNEEPLDLSNGAAAGLGSLFDQLDDQGRIEERIRQLEAVSARARELQRGRQTQSSRGTSHISIVTTDNTSGDGMLLNVEGQEMPQEGTVDRAKSCKRDSSHLVAKALELDADVNKVVGDGGGFFDCNICLDMAREPILTCCGHLFCWPCFYQVPYVYSAAKECPVCKGEVTDTNMIPIYGHAENDHMPESKSGLKIPPRPKAPRIESVRQRRVNRGISHIPVEEALRRITMEFEARGGRPRRDHHGNIIGSNQINMHNQAATSEMHPDGE
ncbi:uncharacterized protein LOC127786833 isoform X2 [Diospyros lotus]|nr:uncharacterized protein LOC127786833 isoform X2 [Diospyros lotus]